MTQKRELHWSVGLGVCASFALFVAAIGLVQDLSGVPDSYLRFGYAVSALAAAAAYLVAGYGLAWAAGALVGLVLQGRGAAITLAWATALGVYTIFSRVFGAYQLPLPNRGGLSTLSLGLLAFLAAVGFFGSVRNVDKDELWKRGLGVLLPASLAALAALVVYWQLGYGGGALGWLGALVLLALAAGVLNLSPAMQSAIAAGMLALVLAGGVANWRMEREYAPTNQLGGVDGKISRVILITIDTLRADSFAGPKGERPATPNVDAFARESYVFENAISSGAWTPPGMTSLLTGLDPLSHGVGMGRRQLPVEIPTLPERMLRAGYQIAGSGLNPIVRTTGMVERWPWIHWHPYRPTPQSIGNFFLGGGVDFYKWNPSTTELTDWALDWMRDNHGSEFYFWLHYYDPHVPYTPPPEFVDSSKQTEAIGPALSIDATERVRVGAPMVDAADRKWLRSLYDAEVTYVDRNVGRFLDSLRELGIYDDSLIIISSDHGEEFFDHGGFEHGQNLYNELVHVPLIVRPPAGASGTTVADFVATASVTPTVLDLAGVEYDPAEMTYPPLSPYLDGLSLEGAGDQATPIFSSGVRFFENWVSVVFDRHKYIQRTVSGREELYNLMDDPGERVNLTDPEMLARGRKLIEERLGQGDAIRKRYGVVDTKEAGLDESTRKQLESLGYIQ